MRRKTRIVRISDKLFVAVDQVAKKNNMKFVDASEKAGKTLSRLNGRRLKLLDEIEF